KIGPDPRNFNQRVSLGRNDLLIRTFHRQITSTNQLLNKRSVEYIQPLEYHAVPLLVLYALFFTMIYR
ncbi:phospholipid:lipid A palmitoyltransferase, partial [Klebsiella pneumoniae subsp. pneumoniae]